MYTPYQNPELDALIGRNLLPLWDERLLVALTSEKDGAGHHTYSRHRATQPYAFRQRRLGNLNVDDSMLLFKEALRDNQAYFVPHPSSPWRVCFPYAWYLKKGDPIDNLTTGEVYTVAQVYDEKAHDVLLSGKRRPRSQDRLRLRSENEIVFNHAYPRLLNRAMSYTTGGSIADKPGPWNDTVTYIVLRSEPGSIDSGPPFRGTVQMKPQFRETFQDPLDPLLMIETDGWFFDNLVQFECWAKTNGEAVNLLKWFEDFMFRHVWIFELYGVSKVLYWRRDEDTQSEAWRNDITKRTVLFYMRTERVFAFQTRKLSQIKLDLSVTTDEEPVADEYLDSAPEPSGLQVWPEPSVSIAVDINEVLGG